jgi:hypothetical protein
VVCLIFAGCAARTSSSGPFTTSIDLNALAGRSIPAGPWGSCRFSNAQRHPGLGDFVHVGGRCHAIVYVFVVDPRLPVGIVDLGLGSDTALREGQLKCYGPDRFGPAVCDDAVRGRVVISLSTPTDPRESRQLAQRVAGMLGRLPQGTTGRAILVRPPTTSSTGATGSRD